jgi:hypothetical protein
MKWSLFWFFVFFFNVRCMAMHGIYEHRYIVQVGFVQNEKRRILLKTPESGFQQFRLPSFKSEFLMGISVLFD